MKQEAEEDWGEGDGHMEGLQGWKGTRVTGEQVWKASSWGAGSLGDPEK